jgi:hypothetical protein
MNKFWKTCVLVYLLRDALQTAYHQSKEDLPNASDDFVEDGIKVSAIWVAKKVIEALLPSKPYISLIGMIGAYLLVQKQSDDIASLVDGIKQKNNSSIENSGKSESASMPYLKTLISDILEDWTKASLLHQAYKMGQLALDNVYKDGILDIAPQFPNPPIVALSIVTVAPVLVAHYSRFNDIADYVGDCGEYAYDKIASLIEFVGGSANSFDSSDL